MTTPMVQQIAALKREAGNAILLVRLGDFYELQGEDAVVAAPVMEILLTTRSKGTEAETPMCGVPFHALDQYLPKLLAAGYSVAIAEPTAKAEEVKGLLPRAIKRIITPGTWLDDDSRWLASVHRSLGASWGLAMLQLTSGRLRVIPGEGEDTLLSTLDLFAPQEVILAESAPEIKLEELSDTAFTRLPDWRFEQDRAKQQILSFFGWQHLEGVGLNEFPTTIPALGALLDQVESTQKGRPSHIQGVELAIGAVGPLLDATSARHLEITANSIDGSKIGSLLNLLDTCRTRMGSRLLRAWLAQPLRDANVLQERWAQVQWLTEDSRRSPLQKLLTGMPDLERLLGRVALGLATPPELAQLRSALQQAQKIPSAILNEDWLDTVNSVGLWLEATPICTELCRELEHCLEEAPSAEIEKGCVIRHGIDAELDSVLRLATDAKHVMLELEESERQKSGIQSLKIKYNRVFGYYFEVTKTNLSAVPPHFIRKQTLVNAERFTTAQLMDFEQRLLSAEADRHRLEERCFQRLLCSVLENRADIQTLAHAIARLDVLCSFAEKARIAGWTKPEITSERNLILAGARHPMLESKLGRGCIPNELTLISKSPMAIVTGPNMGGKSTYLRTAAILVVMAQTGSFVPAELMRFGIVDRIFTRIGASDYLSKGQSTFMVEMTETARILNQTTPSSLVILDEIGRGTSTRDGLALAEAIAMHLRDLKEGAPRTLFATHYFELTKLASDPRIFNLHVEVQEWGEQLHFLHRIAEGPADRSYGIQVARLAGLPSSVIAKAQRILAESLDSTTKTDERRTPETGKSQKNGASKSAEAFQAALLPMFEMEPDPIRQEIETLDLNSMTPLEALNWIAEKKSLSQSRI